MVCCGELGGASLVHFLRRMTRTTPSHNYSYFTPYRRVPQLFVLFHTQNFTSFYLDKLGASGTTLVFDMHTRSHTDIPHTLNSHLMWSCPVQFSGMMSGRACSYACCNACIVQGKCWSWPLLDCQISSGSRLWYVLWYQPTNLLVFGRFSSL
jgi:hypothetical protein